MGSVSVRNISKMSYDSWSLLMYGHFCNSDNGGRSVTSRHNGSQISGSQQSCLTETTQRWPFALSNDERRVMGFRFVPDWNHLTWVAGAWKKWAKERTGAREGDTRGVSPLLARPFFLVPTTPKRLLRRLEIVLHRNCHTCQFFSFFFCHICICSMITFCWDPEILPP